MEGGLQLVRIPEWTQIKGAGRIFARHPLLFTSAFFATSKCMTICNNLFGNTHHRNNRPNAFRHALWNMLLIKNARQLGKDQIRAVAWAEELTSWHEDANPNKPLARAMDLHNNKIGRALYTQKFGSTHPNPEQLTQALLPLLDQAVKIRFPKEVKAAENHLVYITD